MRGGARIGGRNFSPPKPQNGKESYNPFGLLVLGDLPVAPILTPINDNFSWTIDADPADPRDCSRYPSSPYCGGLPLDPKPFGVRTEIRSNGCETCVYIYPVVMWLMATPQVICYRDPNCDREEPPKNRKSRKPPKLRTDIQPDPYQSQECVDRINYINGQVNATNDFLEAEEKAFYYNLDKTDPNAIRDIKEFSEPSEYRRVQGIAIEGDTFFAEGEAGLTYAGVIHRVGDGGDPLSVGIPAGIGYYYIKFNPAPCPNMPPRPTIKPPPPAPDDDDDDDRKKREREKKQRKKMCCNQCSDAADNTAVLLREIKAIKKALGTGQFEKAVDAAVGIGDGSVTAIVNTIAKRIGTSRYPIEVPLTLLTLFKDDDKSQKLESQADYIYWLTLQLDALIGEFPIDIEIKDIDPLTAGDQKKTIQLTNIAETLAEIYGLAIKGSVNQEAEQAILLRLAIEAIAIKNGVAITQDYVKANTKFLGYKGNPKDRELEYGFDFTSIDLNSKEQTVTLDQILKQSKGYIKGWENIDGDTATGFFQKLMFSAGIIKAVFFRDKHQVKELGRQAEEMLKDTLDNNKKWTDFLESINNPNSVYNKDKGEQPEIRVETRDPNKPI